MWCWCQYSCVDDADVDAGVDADVDMDAVIDVFVDADAVFDVDVLMLILMLLL